MISTVNELRETFENNDIPSDINVLFSVFEYENYEGNCLVVFEKNGQLYEVNGYHCSCYGFEGQWLPELTTKESLESRKLNWTGEKVILNDLKILDLKFSNLYSTLDCKSLGALMVCTGILLELKGVNESEIPRIIDALDRAGTAFDNREEM